MGRTIYPDEFLASVCDESGIPRRRISVALGLSAAYISNAVRQVKSVGMETAAKVCYVCGYELVVRDRETKEEVFRVSPRPEDIDETLVPEHDDSKFEFTIVDSDDGVTTIGRGYVFTKAVTGSANSAEKDR